MIRIETPDGKALAKRIVFLAWQACGGSMHMGFLQDRGPEQTEEQVWDHAYKNRDYAGGHDGPANQCRCDYVMGRMMKMNVIFGSNFIEMSDAPPRSDYQSWCRKYKTAQALIDAAVASMCAPAK